MNIMIKKVFNIALLILPLLGLMSCDGNNETREVSLYGEWEVYERRVEIYEDATSTKEQMTAWSKELTDELNKEGVYVYNFGDLVAGAADRYEFTEKQFPLDENGNYDKDEIYPNMLYNSGTYIRKGNTMNVIVTLGVFDNWITDFLIKDLNKVHFMFVQEFDAESLGELYNLYLGYTRSDIDKSVKARMITKARRFKNDK